MHRLVTIPISHYCEKARWALERAGIAYREERHVQLVHRFAARRAGGGPTVPVLVAPDRVLADSADILRYCDEVGAAVGVSPLHPPGDDEPAALERWFDEDLGPQGRAWMYVQLLPVGRAVARWNCAGVPAWERRAFPVMFGLVSPWIRRHLALGPDTAPRAMADVMRTFDAVAERLADGRPYLCGESFTAADLAFGALSAAVLVPPGYGVDLPQPEDLPPAMAAQVRELRAHPAGAFALSLYARRRAG